MSLRLRGDDRGFTLVELMIVMVVLGILAGIVLLTTQPFQQSSIAAACRSEIRTLKTANAAYVVQYGTDAPNDAALLSAGYIEQAPKHATLTNGVTNPADGSGCDTNAPEVALTPDLHVTAMGGTVNDLGGGNWQTDVTITVADDAGNPADGVHVMGTWSDGVPKNSCDADHGTSCTVDNVHHAAGTTSATFTVDTVNGQTLAPPKPSITCTGPPTSSC